MIKGVPFFIAQIHALFYLYLDIFFRNLAALPANVFRFLELSCDR